MALELLDVSELPLALLVTVTADDIVHGERGDCQTCPFARALSRDYPIAGLWTVTEFQAKAGGVIGTRAYDLGDALERAICRFDNDGTSFAGEWRVGAAATGSADTAADGGET